MKKLFDEPKITIECFLVEDVITVSGTSDPFQYEENELDLVLG